jgi:hypothetical protein
MFKQQISAIKQMFVSTNWGYHREKGYLTGKKVGLQMNLLNTNGDNNKMGLSQNAGVPQHMAIDKSRNMMFKTSSFQVCKCKDYSKWGR